LRIAAIGDVDELNAVLGVAISQGLHPLLAEECAAIQNRLFDFGAELASPTGSRNSTLQIDDEDVKRLEDSMDSMSEGLSPLREFILPGGSRASAALHLARCVCRRAERAVLSLSEEAAVRQELLQYLNRLSDWLFTAARTSNAQENVSDIAWKKKEQ
jgi:cob(I)alamin adenosyltransferase